MNWGQARLNQRPISGTEVVRPNDRNVGELGHFFPMFPGLSYIIRKRRTCGLLLVVSTLCPPIKLSAMRPEPIGLARPRWARLMIVERLCLSRRGS